MQVGTGKSILNGIAIGKLKIYKKKDTVISAAEVADTAAEVARFEDARAKAIEQQTALYEKALAEAGISARVINMATIKPLDEEIVLKAAEECGKVITAEEHNIIGGLGEAVCAVLSEKLPTPVRRVGVQDVFGCSGPAWDLLKKFGLDAATICKTAHEMLGK